jgi:hypothetical protein
MHKSFFDAGMANAKVSDTKQGSYFILGQEGLDGNILRSKYHYYTAAIGLTEY